VHLILKTHLLVPLKWIAYGVSPSGLGVSKCKGERNMPKFIMKGGNHGGKGRKVSKRDYVAIRKFENEMGDVITNGSEKRGERRGVGC